MDLKDLLTGLATLCVAGWLARFRRRLAHDDAAERWGRPRPRSSIDVLRFIYPSLRSAQYVAVSMGIVLCLGAVVREHPNRPLGAVILLVAVGMAASTVWMFVSLFGREDLSRLPAWLRPPS
jgi:hypothetical protein